MSIASRLLTATSLVALTLAGACDGSDYITYRVASAATQQGSDCFPDGIPDSIRDDSSTLRAASSMYVFEGPEGERFLEFAEIALAGTLADGVYTFAGESTDYEYPSEDVSTISKTQHEVVFTRDGKHITGTYTTLIDFSCSGPEEVCSTLPVGRCTATTDFTGSEVDVELTHEI